MKLSNLKLATQLIGIQTLMMLLVSVLYFGLIFYSQMTTKSVFVNSMKGIDSVLNESGEKLHSELNDRLATVTKDIGTTVQNLSTGVLDNLAWQVRGEAGMFVERAVGQTRNFANTVRVYLTETPMEKRDRAALTQFLKAHASDPEFCGASICFEANAFDGKDDAFKYDEKTDAADAQKKKDLGCFEDGRFMPWASTKSGSVTVEPLDGPDEDESGYYTVPKKTHKEFLTPPYDYQGQVMISVAIPVLDGDNLLAVVTTDLDVIHLENILKKHKPFNTGYAYLVDDKGNIVWHPNKDLVLKNLSDIQEWKVLGDFVKKAEFGRVAVSEVQDAKKQLLQVYVPIQFGHSPNIWGIIVSAVVHDYMQAATDTENNINALDKAVNEQIGGLVSTIHNADQTMEKQIQDNNSTSMKIVIAASLVILLLVGGIAVMVGRSFSSPIISSVAVLRSVAEEGDLSQEVPGMIVARGDEIGDVGRGIKQILTDYNQIAARIRNLANGDWTDYVQEKGEKDTLNHDFRDMYKKVNQTLRDISGSVEQVATGSGEVSNAAQSLASGAQSSAASLEEITASMSEIGGQTKTNAEDATQARDLALQASKAATEGQTAMQNMTGAMERITQNSHEIQRVIKVIDDIAFQTNLLALNAAVEAARAGQHGKGFAVVAEEVRNLAARSAKAAQETSELIAKSGHEIEKGGEVAAHTAEVLNSIVEQVKQTTELIGGIATASNEQAAGVNQVSIGLHQIDSVTQQNTAAAEESASAANEMSSMAVNLQKLVAQFKLRQ